MSGRPRQEYPLAALACELPAPPPGGGLPPAAGYYDRHLFGCFLFAKRVHRGLARGRVDREAGVKAGACRRAEERRELSADEFEALCQWQGEEPEIFTGGNGQWIPAFAGMTGGGGGA